MPASAEQIRATAEIGAKIIRLQLSLADSSVREAFHQAWPIGYCFGAFDALAVHYQLNWDADGIALITAGFSRLAGEDAGSKLLKRALDMQTNRFFAEGRQYGGDDFCEWLKLEDFRPLSLVTYLGIFSSFGRPTLLNEL